MLILNIFLQIFTPVTFIAFILFIIKVTINKAKLHYKLLQIEDPEEFANYTLFELSSSFKGSLYGRTITSFLFFPFFFQV